MTRFLPVLLLTASACATTAPLKGTAMEQPSIVQTGAQVLRARAAEVPPERIATPGFQALVAQMVAAMRAAPGVGLAAPQLGVGLRVFVVEDRAELMATLTPAEREERLRAPVPLKVLINPTVTPVGEEKATFFEGCLSVAGYAALVERFLEVEVKALDEHGAKVSWRVRGWPARILQHEADHLDGTLYLDRMKTRSFGTLPQVKALYGGKPIDEVRRLLGE
jgi:peptide deformylase